MFYVVKSDGYWLPLPFIAISIIWFSKFKRYEIKENKNGEYYIFDNIGRNSLDLRNSNWWWMNNKDDFKYCLTKDKSVILEHYNRLIG